MANRLFKIGPPAALGAGNGGASGGAGSGGSGGSGDSGDSGSSCSASFVVALQSLYPGAQIGRTPDGVTFVTYPDNAFAFYAPTCTAGFISAARYDQALRSDT